MSHDADPPPPRPPARARFGTGLERRPLYRVVEFVRDDRGRLREEGRIWHSDLHRVRQFGRAVAGNTTGARVVIADNAGRVVEELPLPTLDHPAQGQWDGWRAQPLPALPAGAPRPSLRREVATTPASAWVLPVEPKTSPPPPGKPPALPAPVDPSPGSAVAASEGAAAPPARPPRDLPTLDEHDTVVPAVIG